MKEYIPQVQFTDVKAVWILYINHRDECRFRYILPTHHHQIGSTAPLWFGKSPWHPGKEQWFLRAYDLQAGSCGPQTIRDFALKDIKVWTDERPIVQLPPETA